MFNSVQSQSFSPIEVKSYRVWVNISYELKSGERDALAPELFAVPLGTRLEGDVTTKRDGVQVTPLDLAPYDVATLSHLREQLRHMVVAISVIKAVDHVLRCWRE